MPRSARFVLEGIPYHVTQRGNRRSDVFFCEEHYVRYLDWLEEYAEKHRLEMLAYCLMTTHVHLISIPHAVDSLARTLQVLHTRHSQLVNAEHGWVGHLWQGRFFSTPLDERHLMMAVRYVERNPVCAGMVKQAEDYPWSSAAFHLGLAGNKVIKSDTIFGSPLEGWQELLGKPEDEDTVERIRHRTQVGFPCGDDEFVGKVSRLLGRDLVLRPRGRPRKSSE